MMEGVEGIHFHNLCEQTFEPLRQTWDRVFDAIEPWFGQLKWINMGGGHHITRADYEREELTEFLRDAAAGYRRRDHPIEPGEAVALDAGILVGTLLDTRVQRCAHRHHGHQLRRATCLTYLEAPYRPAMLGELADEEQIRDQAWRAIMPRWRCDRRLPAARASRTGRALRLPRSSTLFHGENQHFQWCEAAQHLVVGQRNRRARMCSPV